MDKKQKIIRIVLFAAALITASTAFAIAAVNIAANKTGYKTIAASPDEDAVLYASDFTFKYYFEGRSGEITEQNKQVTAVYSQALARAYKLLDPSVSYNGLFSSGKFSILYSLNFLVVSIAFFVASCLFMFFV